ncbi:MAG: Uma2 family endonuclease [Gemmataceae bacterium]|nr:Uma2 family endonuclease [Gemmataceae bacterium]
METEDHNYIRTIITVVVGSIILNEALGRWYADRMLLTHEGAGLSNEPDAMFVSFNRFANGLAVLKKGGTSKELIGSPNMTLEVIRKSSINKDRVALMAKYAQAGIDKYWLVDSTIETPVLEIYRLVSGKYVVARSNDGWVKSHLFGRSFRLTTRTGGDGVILFALKTK